MQVRRQIALRNRLAVLVRDLDELVVEDDVIAAELRRLELVLRVARYEVARFAFARIFERAAFGMARDPIFGSARTLVEIFYAGNAGLAQALRSRLDRPNSLGAITDSA